MHTQANQPFSNLNENVGRQQRSASLGETRREVGLRAGQQVIEKQGPIIFLGPFELQTRLIVIPYRSIPYDNRDI